MRKKKTLRVLIRETQEELGEVLRILHELQNAPPREEVEMLIAARLELANIEAKDKRRARKEHT